MSLPDCFKSVFHEVGKQLYKIATTEQDSTQAITDGTGFSAIENGTEAETCRALVESVGMHLSHRSNLLTNDPLEVHIIKKKKWLT